jgi:hypothetical protein
MNYELPLCTNKLHNKNLIIDKYFSRVQTG